MLHIIVEGHGNVFLRGRVTLKESTYLGEDWSWVFSTQLRIMQKSDVHLCLKGDGCSFLFVYLKSPLLVVLFLGGLCSTCVPDITIGFHVR